DDQPPVGGVAQIHRDVDQGGRPVGLRQSEGHRAGARRLDGSLEVDDPGNVGHRCAGGAASEVGPPVHQGQRGVDRGGGGRRLGAGATDQRRRDRRGGDGARRGTAQARGQTGVVIAGQAPGPRPAGVLILACEHESSPFWAGGPPSARSGTVVRRPPGRPLEQQLLIYPVNDYSAGCPRAQPGELLAGPARSGCQAMTGRTGAVLPARSAPAHTPVPYATSSARWPSTYRTGSSDRRRADQAVSGGPSSSEPAATRRPQRRARPVPPGATSAAASTGAPNWQA